MVLTKGESVWGALATHTARAEGGGGNLSNKKTKKQLCPV